MKLGKGEAQSQKKLSREFERQSLMRGHGVGKQALGLGFHLVDDLIGIFGGIMKQNEFFDGECDNSQGKVIRDIKSSWIFESFPLTETGISNKLYQWQLDAYMDLYECDQAELIYCLVDTPTDLIEDELRRMDWKHNISDHVGNIREEHIPLIVETVSNHIYSFKGLEEFCHQSNSVMLSWFENFKEIPEAMRVKIFKQKHSQQRVDQLKQMIQLSRDHMDHLFRTIQESVLENVWIFKTH